MSADRDETGRFAPGHNLGGRPKGSTGAAAAHLRDAIVSAFDKAGGADWLASLAESQPELLVRLVAQLLPRRAELAVERPAGDGRIDLTPYRNLSRADLVRAANAGLIAKPLEEWPAGFIRELPEPDPKSES